MEKKSFYGVLLLCVLISAVFSDTFKHKQTGETFTGFVTQKTTGNMTRVYNSDTKKFTPVSLSDYEVTFNQEGRRENIVLVPITKPEVLMSQTISEQVAQAIVDASNAGPLAILVQIDSPGGRGEYMKIIASAISQTTNCPVIAYISGGSYGGAFNAAAVVALACDKVFIAPTAAIGAVGPLVGSSRTADDYGSFLNTYAPDTLVTYSTYVSALAQEKKRPQTLIRGLIDKKLAIIEVTNPNGSRDYILKDERQPNQTVVRTLAEGMTYEQQGQSGEEKSSSAIEVAGTVLNLTAADAVKTGLADEIAASRQDVMAAMQVPNAQTIPAQGIDNVIKKFAAARRNIMSGLAQISRLETEAERLDASLQQVEDQLRTGTRTRQVETPRYNTSRRQRLDEYPGVDNRYYDYGEQNRVTNPYLRQSPRESITTVEPTVNPDVIRQQLAGLLRQLLGEYRRVINLAERWPGGLPLELSLTTLQSNMDSATAQLNNLYTLDMNNRNPNIVNQPMRRGY